jgi:hypothetical protein
MGVSKHVYATLAAELARIAEARRAAPGDEALAA